MGLPAKAHWSFSYLGMLNGVLVLALVTTVLRASLSNVPRSAEPLGGLSLVTLLFAVMCWLCGLTAGRVLVFSGLLYGWGLACVLCGDAGFVTMTMRSAWAVIGVAFSFWVWMSDQP